MLSVFTPNWFTRFDILIGIFSFLVLLTFFIVSIKNYKLTKNKKLMYLGMGFLLVSLAELADIFTKFVLYHKITVFQNVGLVTLKYEVLRFFDLPYDLGFFMYKFLTLLGLYIIYRLPLKNKNWGDAVLAVLFIILASLAGQIIYYIFHIITFVILALIINNYFKVYKKNQNQNTKLLLSSFIIIAIAHAIFILSKLPSLYVLGEIIELLGYIGFLSLIIRINKNEWSKRK